MDMRNIINEKRKRRINREDYLIVKAVDLAKAFGLLNLSEKRMLNFAVSCITEDSNENEEYTVEISEILKIFGISAGGKATREVTSAFQRLMGKTTVALQREKGYTLINTFQRVDIGNEGKVKFKFSAEITPYLFQLKDKYYSSKLAEIAGIKSKHTLTLFDLWRAKKHGTNKVTVMKGTLEDWKLWFLGANKDMETSRFTAQVLKKACKDIEEKYRIKYEIVTVKDGTKIIGYEIWITE